MLCLGTPWRLYGSCLSPLVHVCFLSCGGMTGAFLVYTGSQVCNARSGNTRLTLHLVVRNGGDALVLLYYPAYPCYSGWHSSNEQQINSWDENAPKKLLITMKICPNPRTSRAFARPNRYRWPCCGGKRSSGSGRTGMRML